MLPPRLRVLLPVVVVLAPLTACHDPSPSPSDHEACTHDEPVEPVDPPLLDHPAVANLSVAERDRPTSVIALGDPMQPIEARLLVLSADGAEPELGAIQSVLRHRGVPARAAAPIRARS